MYRFKRNRPGTANTRNGRVALAAIHTSGRPGASSIVTISIAPGRPRRHRAVEQPALCEHDGDHDRGADPEARLAARAAEEVRGGELPISGEELAAEIARLHGRPVQMMRLEHGIFDEACISVITAATINEIEAACGHGPDVRRFRPNILIRTEAPRAFEEDRRRRGPGGVW